jgi:hypothetical protein
MPETGLVRKFFCLFDPAVTLDAASCVQLFFQFCDASSVQSSDLSE